MRQVGAFSGFVLLSSTNIDVKMNFSPGSLFVFGSWVCVADSNGLLHAYLVENSDDQLALIQSVDMMDELAENISDFSILDSTWIQEQFKFELYSNSISDVPFLLPLGLKNSTSIY